MISMARHHRYNRRYHRPHVYQKPIDYRFKTGIIFVIIGIAFFGLSFLIGKLNAPLNDTIVFAFFGLLFLVIGLIIISPAGRKKQNVNVFVSQR